MRQFSDFVKAHENCFERGLTLGHVTASAWVLDPSSSQVLLTHHRKLGKWLQLGGHMEGESDVAAAALREAFEESGLQSIELLSAEIFDLDIHQIPRRESDAAHLHFDARFLMRATGNIEVRASDESHALAWVSLADLEGPQIEFSIQRMAYKTKLWLSSGALSPKSF